MDIWGKYDEDSKIIDSYYDKTNKRNHIKNSKILFEKH